MKKKVSQAAICAEFVALQMRCSRSSVDYSLNEDLIELTINKSVIWSGKSVFMANLFLNDPETCYIIQNKVMLDYTLLLAFENEYPINNETTQTATNH